MKVLSLLLAWTVSMLAFPLLAQQKPLPPASPMQIRQTAKDTLSSPKQERQKLLELPEILVVGQDTSRRIPQTKSYPAAQQITYRHQPVVFRRPFAVPDLQPSLRQILQKTPATNQHSTIHFSFGSYQTTFLNARHRQRLKQGVFHFEGGYTSSEGQYANSQFERWFADFSARFQLQKAHSIQADAVFHSNRYGMYGDVRPFRRKWQSFRWSAATFGQPNRTLSYRLEVTQTHLPFAKTLDKTDTLAVRAPTRETATVLKGEITAMFQDWRIRFQAGTNRLRESPDTLAVATSVSIAGQSRLGYAELIATRRISGRGILEFGIRQFGFRADSRKRTKTYPFLTISWSLSPEQHLTIQYTGEMQLFSVEQMASLNPFFSFIPPTVPIQESPQVLKAALKWTPGNGFRVHGSFAYTSYRDYFYWQRDTVSFRSGATVLPNRNVFSLKPLEKVHIFRVRAGIEAGNLAPWILRASVQWTDSRIDRFGPAIPKEKVLIKEIPYLEETGIQLEVQYNIASGWVAQIEGHYFGSRPISLFSLKRADSIWLVNGKMTYTIVPFRLYVHVWNLLNQKFYLWEYYPLTTLQISGGLNVQF